MYVRTYIPSTCVPAMERANDVTRSFLYLRLLPALPVAWLPPWQRHSPQVSWQISVFPEAARPIYGFKIKIKIKKLLKIMATCRAQTSLQPPLALPDTSSHCLLGFLFFFFKYTIAEMKGAWEFFISKLPACRHYIIKCSIFLQFYAVLESAQKCALLRAKGLNGAVTPI